MEGNDPVKRKGIAVGKNNELVITVGGANGERVLSVKPMEFRLGAKHTLSPVRIMAGGSSLNHSCRLLAMGFQVFPVLPVVDDDVGQVIVEALEHSAAAGRVKANFEDINHSNSSSEFFIIII